MIAESRIELLAPHAFERDGTALFVSIMEAERLFLGEGLSTASIGSIASASGLSEAELSRRFPTVEGLAVAAIERRFDAWSRWADRAIDGALTPVQGLLAPFEAPELAIIGQILVRGRSESQASTSAVAGAIQAGVGRVRGWFASAVGGVGAIDPVTLSRGLGSLWIGAAMSGTWDDALGSATALLAAHGVGLGSEAAWPHGDGGLAVRHSDARFRAIFEASPLSIEIVAPDGHRIMANPAWQRRNGFGRGGDSADDKAMAPLLRRAFAGEVVSIRPTPSPASKRNGRRTESSSQGFLFPIKDGSGAVREVAVLRQDASELEQAERLAKGQAEVLRRMLDALAVDHDLDPFLGQAVQAMSDQLGADSAALWLADDVGTLQFQLEYEGGRIAPGWSTTESGFHQPFCLPSGPAGRESLAALRAVGYEYIEDVATDLRLIPYRAELTARGVRTILVLHLFLGDERVGAISLRNRDLRHYRPEEITLALALGRLATLAIRLARLADGARTSGVLQERNRMAREIHDTLAQGLAAIVLQLEACEFASLAGPPEEARKYLDRARDQARRCLTEARHSVWALRPPELERSDLASALPEHLMRLTEAAPSTLRFRIVGRARPLRAEVEDELFRIGQEATINALKHARAGEIRVELGFGDDRIWLAVEDDGQGIEPRAPRDGCGFGLLGMRDRADRLGGRLTIGRAGEDGGGTRVLVEVPVSSPAHPRGINGP